MFGPIHAEDQRRIEEQRWDALRAQAADARLIREARRSAPRGVLSRPVVALLFQQILRRRVQAPAAPPRWKDPWTAVEIEHLVTRAVDGKVIRLERVRRPLPAEQELLSCVAPEGGARHACR